MTDRQIALHKPEPVMLPTANEWSLMLDMASALVPTGFLPESINNPQKAVAIILKGRELGVPPMYALSNIVIVKGKPTISAEMMLALIYRDHGKRSIRVKTSDDNQCVIEYRLDGWADTSSYTFSLEQAKKAGLISNPTWTKYPAAMLRARCISAVARMAFPESIAGMYVPGELGEPTTVTDEGEVMSVPTASAVVVDQDTGEISGPTALPQPDPDRAMKRIHAVAKEHGLTHEHLHAWAVSRGRPSLTDMSDDDLDTMASRIERNPSDAAEWFTGLVANQQAPMEPGQSEIEGLDDLHAQLNRDRAAERARA